MGSNLFTVGADTNRVPPRGAPVLSIRSDIAGFLFLSII
jgi:hypothetical protein